MKGGGARSIDIRLPTLLVGPRAHGRNYDILRRTPDAVMSRDAQIVLTDFVLALAGWADRRLDRFVAFFPIDDQTASAALVRGRYLGDGSYGTIGIAAVALVDAATLSALNGEAHRLLPLLGDPERAEIGVASIAAKVEINERPASARLARLGVGWRDRVLDTGGADAEAVLVEALDSIHPAAQRARITGWATTASLPHVGRFSPAAAFRLVTHRSDDQWTARDLPHLPMRLEGDRLVGDDVQVPEARQAWERLKALDGGPAIRAAIDSLTWSVEGAEMAASDLVAVSIIDVCLQLGALSQVMLLKAVAEKAADPADPIAPALRGGLERAFAGLVEAASSPKAAALYIAGYVAGGPRVVGQAWPVLEAASRRVEILAELDDDALGQLMCNGLLDAVGSLSPRDLESLPADRAYTLLTLSLERGLGAPYRRLAGMLLVRLARGGDLDRERTVIAAKLLESLMSLAQHADDRDLADAAIVELVRDHAPAAYPSFVRRSLSAGWANSTAATFVATGLAVLTALKSGPAKP